MAYTDSRHNPNRTATIATVALIHAGLGYAIMTGFAGGVMTEAGKTIKTIWMDDDTVDIPLPPPPPVPEAEPSERVIDTPITPVDSPLTSDRDFTVPKVPHIDTFPTGLPTTTVTLPQDTFSPKPLYSPVPATPRGNTGTWVTPDDYPSRPLRRGIEGRTGFRLIIGTDGRVTDCSITRTSGNAELDRAACTNLSRRAKFDPAKDGNGDLTTGEYSSTIVWEIPG